MYFNFDDGRPDIEPVGRAISWREGVLLSLALHALMAAILLLGPTLPFVKALQDRAREERLRRLEEITKTAEPPRHFVFVAPRPDGLTLKPKPDANFSDESRDARARERARDPQNLAPFSRGNSPAMVDERGRRAERGNEAPPAPSPSPSPTPAESSAPVLPDLAASRPAPRNGAPTQNSSGSLADAIRNLQRYVAEESFENPQGAGGSIDQAFQFDSKGVDFGPWIRRFRAQIYRNWFIPQAAMLLRGRVVLQFNVHRDGTITALAVVQPSQIGAFNNAAFNALASSNPTPPLPSEYPSDKVFFTVTFFYNETPGR